MLTLISIASGRERPSHPGSKPCLRVPQKWAAKQLQAFFRFASEQGFSPHEIGPAAFDAHSEALANSTLNKARTRDREIRKIWNNLVASDPTISGSAVKVPSYVDHYVLPADAFPQSLWDDLDGYLAFRSQKNSLDLDDLLTEEELFGEGEVTDQADPASTASLIRYRVRQFASVLVTEGILPADQIVDLAVLVAPITVRAGLMFFVRRAGQQRNSQIRGIASTSS